MSNLKTFLIIAAVVVAAVGIGYMAGERDPNLYNKIEQAEEQTEECIKAAYKEAKDKTRKMVGRDKKAKGGKSDKDYDCPGETIESEEIIIIQE